jgi:glycosyltransferase involved in cell wall biosynthesis
VQRPTLSICIPTRNRRLFLARHLRHIATFKDLDYEVVVSDNCSDDDTLGVVDTYRDELKSVVYVRQETPLSFYESQMAAMNSAGGHYAICTADDDFVVEAGLIQAVQKLDADPSVSAVYGAWEGWRPDKEEREFKAIAVNEETRVNQRDLIHWYLNAATPELPILRTDILHRSHVPFQNQYGFDFYGAALLSKHGDLLMIQDTTVRVTLHAGQESQSLYRPDVLQCYLADYELFFSQFRSMSTGVGAQMVTHVLAKQYMAAADRAIGRGHYLMGRDLLLRCRVYLPELAENAIRNAWAQYRMYFIAESVTALVTSMKPVERIFIEAGPDAVALRNSVSNMRRDDIVLVGSRDEILGVSLTPADLVIGADESLREDLSEKFGFWVHKFRTFDALENAVRCAPQEDLSVEEYLDNASLIETQPPSRPMAAAAH